MVNHPNRARKPLHDSSIHEVFTDNDGQFRTIKYLERVNGKVFRTIVRLDTSTPHQSSAELAVYLPEVGFAVLLSLYGHEVYACRAYHGASPVGRQDKVLTWLHHTHSLLLDIGCQIVRED